MTDVDRSRTMKRILVCDDEDALVRILRTSLISEGYDVDTAFDGVECLRKVQLDRPDLLILDVMMPRKDGIQVLTELKSHAATAEIAVIMLTAQDAIDVNDKAVRLGCDYFLPKPFVPGELVAIVRKVFGKAA